MANKHLPRPVINCEQQAIFYFIYIAYVRIDDISLNGCLNKVSMINEFIMKDSIMLGNENTSRRALFVIHSSITIVRSQFESFTEAIYLLQSSSCISHCTFSNNTALTKGGALHIDNRCNITIEHSTFSFHTCYTVHSCEGAVLYSKYSELLITNCTFDNNRDGAVDILFQSKVRIINSYFSGNIAHEGAAIQAKYDSKITITDTHFCYNEVDFDYYKRNAYSLAIMPGGAIHCYKCKLEIIHGIFEHNKGVALLGLQAHIKIKSCQFSHNCGSQVNSRSAGLRTLASHSTIVHQLF